MSDILKTFAGASYEGIDFPVESADTQGGHDFAAHVAYRRRGADMEWTGLRQYTGTLTIPLIDTPALVERYGAALDLRFDLQRKFEDTPIGLLTHPTFGAFRAAITDWSEPIDSTQRSGVKWTVKWSEHNGEAGSLLAPDSPSTAPTAPEVSQRAAEADAAGAGVEGYVPASPKVNAGLAALTGVAVGFTAATVAINTMLAVANGNAALPGMGRVGAYAALVTTLRLRSSVLGLRGLYLPSATARYFTVPSPMALHEVAMLVYGDASRVANLYDGNSVTDPLFIGAGRVLLIPPLPPS